MNIVISWKFGVGYSVILALDGYPHASVIAMTEMEVYKLIKIIEMLSVVGMRISFSKDMPEVYKNRVLDILE